MNQWNAKISFCSLVLLALLLCTGCGNGKTIQGPEGLEQSNPHYRRNTAFWYGKSGRSDTVDWMSRTLETDGDATVRAAAAHSLGQHGDPSATTVLRKGLLDSNPTVRWNCVESLAWLQVQDAVGDIEALLVNDSDGWVRNAAAKALGSLQSDASLGSLIAALDDGDTRVRFSSARSLGQITHREDGHDFEAWKIWWGTVNE